MAKPLLHISKAYLTDEDTRIATPLGMVDDASRLNGTSMEVLQFEQQGFIEELRSLLFKATSEHLVISIAGARHSMGGHTLYPGGVTLDMRSYNTMQMVDDNTLEVGSGALWSEVIPFLDARGLSVSVMQSNNSFSVGGSISVNCHGWQWNEGPIASTVEGFTIMLADGRILKCCRSQNRDIFSAALGGYGLIGVILDVRLKVVENTELQREQLVIECSECEEILGQLFEDNIEMGFGRVAVAEGLLFKRMIWHTYRRMGVATSKISSRGAVGMKRAIFRGSETCDYGKWLRWQAEVHLQPVIDGETVSRNHLLSESTDLYENRSRKSTDILHEYFVPVDKVEAFMASARGIILNSDVDLLNVTVRSVKSDRDTVLSYAPDDRIAFVMLFCQSITELAEYEMEKTTRKLIDLSLELGGNYYLPYRPHATVSQFQIAYPNWEKFNQCKQRLDPTQVFQNKFYQKYLSN